MASRNRTQTSERPRRGRRGVAAGCWLSCMRSEITLLITLFIVLLIKLFPGVGRRSFQHMTAEGCVEVTEDTLTGGGKADQSNDFGSFDSVDHIPKEG